MFSTVLAEPIQLPSCPAITVPLSASIGIAHAHGTETAEDILRNADLAMYAAKAHGKSRYERYTPAMHVVSVGRLDLANQLRQASGPRRVPADVSNRYFGCTAIASQVPRRCCGGNIRHVGCCRPMRSSSMAEETGLIVSIGAWVLAEACRELGVGRTHTPAYAPGVAVNLSGRQLEPDLVSIGRTVARAYRLDPGNLTLEITEGLITGEGRVAHETLRALKSLGVWLSIDDFGTGHSSLGRLRDYEFDELKIDRSFVGDLDSATPRSSPPRSRWLTGSDLEWSPKESRPKHSSTTCALPVASRCKGTSSPVPSRRPRSARSWRAAGNGASRSRKAPIRPRKPPCRWPGVPRDRSPTVTKPSCRDDATANDVAGLDVVPKVPAISVPLPVAGAVDAMRTDPVVDRLRGRSPRDIRRGTPEAEAARREAVLPQHARDVLDTSEDVWWAAPSRLAVAEQIGNRNSTSAFQQPGGFCEH